MKKRRLNVKAVAVAVLGLLVVLGVVWTGFNLLFKEDKMPTQLQLPETITQEIGTGKFIYENKKNYIIAVHYPVTGLTEIDKNLKETIDLWTEEFKEEHAEFKANSSKEKMILGIHYEVFKVEDQYLSVVFKKATGTDLENLNYQIIKTITYDQKTGEQVGLDTIFHGKYLEKIAAFVRMEYRKSADGQEIATTPTFTTGTEATVENYQYYVLRNNQLIIYFQPNQLAEGSQWSEFKLDIEKLAFYLNESYLSNPVIEPSTTNVAGARYIDPDKPMVALTFDDGPANGITNRIIEALVNNDSAATFFVVGSRVSNNSSLIEQIITTGNEIGNHTYSHTSLTKMSDDEFFNEINGVINDVNAIITTDVNIIRPTYGNYNQHVKDLSPYPLILWSIDTEDWKYRDADRIYEHVMANVKDGDIILLHDLYESSAAAAERLIPALIEKGYQIVTVSELMEYKGIIMEPGGVYSSGR